MIQKRQNLHLFYTKRNLMLAEDVCEMYDAKYRFMNHVKFKNTSIRTLHKLMWLPWDTIP